MRPILDRKFSRDLIIRTPTKKMYRNRPDGDKSVDPVLHSGTSVAAPRCRVGGLNVQVDLPDLISWYTGPSTVDSNSWNMGLGRCMLVFFLLFGLELEDNHIPTFWLLL